MSLDDSNPYASPRIPDAAADNRGRLPSSRIRWRLFPALGVFVLGLISFGVGLFAVAVMSYCLFVQVNTRRVVEMLAGCSLYLGFGISWMAAGWCFWKSRWLIGLLALAIGLLIPSLLFVILGF